MILAFISFRLLERLLQDDLKTLHWLGILGKWSMLDVMVVALMVILPKSAPLLDMEPRIGVYFFSAAVLCSMIVSRIIEQLVKIAT